MTLKTYMDELKSTLVESLNNKRGIRVRDSEYGPYTDSMSQFFIWTSVDLTKADVDIVFTQAKVDTTFGVADMDITVEVTEKNGKLNTTLYAQLLARKNGETVKTPYTTFRDYNIDMFMDDNKMYKQIDKFVDNIMFYL